MVLNGVILNLLVENQLPPKTQDAEMANGYSVFAS